MVQVWTELGGAGREAGWGCQTDTSVGKGGMRFFKKKQTIGLGLRLSCQGYTVGLGTAAEEGSKESKASDPGAPRAGRQVRQHKVHRPHVHALPRAATAPGQRLQQLHHVALLPRQITTDLAGVGAGWLI